MTNMWINYGMDCCAIQEIACIYNDKPKTILNYLRFNRFGATPFYVFSNVKGDTGGADLASFIRKHKLGRVLATRFSINPNTDNKVKMWVWTVDWDAMDKYWNHPQKNP